MIFIFIVQSLIYPQIHPTDLFIFHKMYEYIYTYTTRLIECRTHMCCHRLTNVQHRKCVYCRINFMLLNLVLQSTLSRASHRILLILEL